MSTPDIERLQSIKTLPSLISYLKHDLDWPIATEDIEDIVFDYNPEELGLAPDQSVKIKDIKQIRPLEANQPWGIFWVNFEKKRLPVVLLRRILGHLIIKKRASSNKASHRAWHASDLLFISAYGEENDRAITFAHFAHVAAISGDLPILKVLGWDGSDTVLHLADVYRTLTEKLHWPSKPDDFNAWRNQWAAAFTLRHREVITTTQELVEELAQLATSIRKRTESILARETEQGPMRRLYAAFQTALIHDLSKEDFADVIAQTISYGLLAARFSSSAPISIKSLVEMVPHTNPFLRELLAELLSVNGRKKGAFDFDELGIQDVVELLNLANAEAVKVDFGNKTSNEDPVIHFYEHFLNTYDKKKRIQRGVFFTPQPVVSYIVRSIHELLQSEFGLEDGLADTTTWGEMAARNKELIIPEGAKPSDPFVLILDPATGTATFLVEVIEVIFKHLENKWSNLGKKPSEIAKLWNEYVTKNLLPRLYGYELMMAPYTIAHMKLGLKLTELNTRLGLLGFEVGNIGRAHIYLTNSLEPAKKDQKKFESFFPALAHEAAAVNLVKHDKRFTVVIGNPPYSSVSSNRITWSDELIERYKKDVRSEETQIQVLSDDYVRFIALGCYELQISGVGLLGFITNNNFFTGRVFRDMRNALIIDHCDIRLLDLHGNSRLHEKPPNGGLDENVFDIVQGVGITLLTTHKKTRATRILRADLWGERQNKYKFLADQDLSQTLYIPVNPKEPLFQFDSQDELLSAEYEKFRSLTSFFGSGDFQADKTHYYGTGFKSQQDDFAIAFSRADICSNVETLLVPTQNEVALRKHFSLCTTTQWSFATARKELRRDGWQDLVTKCLYRPFDIRWTVFHRGIISNLRVETMIHLFRRGGLSLCTMRGTRVRWQNHALVSSRIVSKDAVSLLDMAFVFPVTRCIPADSIFASAGRETNFNLRLINPWLSYLSRNINSSGISLNSNDVLNYIYSILYSSKYQTRYNDLLRKDFPRLPLTSSPDLFLALTRLGGELIALHLMESPKLEKHITKWVGSKKPDVERVTYAQETVWIDKAQSIGFRDVPEDVWNFHIGGYQVCEKWLKDRKGRKLSTDDIDHYQKIIVALSETIRLMVEIDKVIEAHGGWPAAFQKKEAEQLDSQEHLLKVADEQAKYGIKHGKRNS